jgi:hypothetical protein
MERVKLKTASGGWAEIRIPKFELRNVRVGKIQNDVMTGSIDGPSQNVILSTARPQGGADTWDDMYRPPTQQARRLLHKG